jgi:hypothetical protein
MGIINFFKSLKRKCEAKREGVPYEKRMWYNYRAMLPKDILAEKSFIEIFDADGRYINCPGIGGTVTYNDKGRRFLYEVIGFDNDSRNRDWLYEGDWINPIVRYVEKLKEENA